MSGISGSMGSLPGDHPSHRMRISNMAALSQNLDTDALVEANMKAAEVPLVELQQTQAQQAQLQAVWRSLQKKLEGFKNTAESLHLEGNFNAFKAQTPPNSGFTLTPSDNAHIGHHDISVASLARPGVVVSSGLADPDKASVLNIPPDGALSHGIITFLIGDHLIGGSYKTIRIDQSSGFTLNDLASAINKSKIGVHAMVMRTGQPGRPYSLSLSSSKNGLNFRVAGTEGIGMTFHVVQKASMAHLTVDGVPVVSSSNDVKDAVPGTVLHLVSPTSGNAPVGVSIVHDRKKITSNIQAFVKNYNDLINFISENSRYDKATGRGGPFLGSFTVTDIRNRLATTLTKPITGNGPYHTLSDIGLDFGQDGRLTLNQSTLDRALGGDYKGVVGVLAGSAGKDRTEGVLRTLHSDLDDLTNPVTGPVTGELSALTNEGESTEKEIEHKSESLSDLRDSLEEKYSNLQSLLGGLNAKQNYVSQQIAKGTL